MPVEMFSGERGVGVLSRRQSVHDAFRKTLGLPPTKEKDWYQVDVAMITRRAQRLGMIGARQVAEVDPEAILSRIENRYMHEAIEKFNIQLSDDESEERVWSKISHAYSISISGLSLEAREQEDLRRQTARTLQLNAYTATWDEIREEIEDLDILPALLGTE